MSDSRFGQNVPHSEDSMAVVKVVKLSSSVSPPSGGPSSVPQGQRLGRRTRSRVLAVLGGLDEVGMVLGVKLLDEIHAISGAVSHSGRGSLFGM